MSIYIFSRPIHSGKTMALQQWCNTQKNILGILMPDINGSRKILNLGADEIFDIECVDVANTKEPITSIGKYNFYAAAFERANSILLNALSQNPDWLVIDEVGKLELNREGFYIPVAEAINLYNNEGRRGNLLITVRDSLCEDVSVFFKIRNFKIVDNLDKLK